MRRPRGPGWDPLVIQIYIPTREYIPTIHSAHVTIQMLLALHSKINIFTQNKGINNLWGKITSNSKLLGFCSHLVTSLHVTVNDRPLPAPALAPAQPACLSQKAPRAACLAPDATRCLYEGKGTAARRHLEAHPTVRLGPGNSTPAPTLPCWDIHHTL